MMGNLDNSRGHALWSRANNWPGAPTGGGTRGVYGHLKLERVQAQMMLRWQHEKAPTVTPRPAPRHALAAFVRLADGPESGTDVLRFARRWGVLATCRHGVTARAVHDAKPACAGLPSCEEPVMLWRAYARQVRALRALVRAIRSENSGELDDWRALAAAQREAAGLVSRGASDDPESVQLFGLTVLAAELPIADARALLEESIRTLMGRASLAIAFTWNSRSPGLELGGIGVLGIVTRELIAEIGVATISQPCQVCGTEVFPARPRSGRPRVSILCADCDTPRARARLQKQHARSRARRRAIGKRG